MMQHSRKGKLKQEQLLLLGIIVMATLFTYLFPAQVLTSEYRIHRLEYHNICQIKANTNNQGFTIEYKDGRQIVAKEPYSIFLKRTNFNWRPLANYYEKTPEGLTFKSCMPLTATTAACDDPLVKGLNVFYIRGFIKINSQMFVVIYGDGDFDDCNCKDPKVILGKKPYCKLIYHGTKKDIISKARDCGLGDYFPEKNCN